MFQPMTTTGLLLLLLCYCSGATGQLTDADEMAQVQPHAITVPLIISAGCFSWRPRRRSGKRARGGSWIDACLSPSRSGAGPWNADTDRTARSRSWAKLDPSVAGCDSDPRSAGRARWNVAELVPSVQLICYMGDTCANQALSSSRGAV